MELWIRSQNKESLAIIKSLCYANHGDKNVVMGGEETTFDIVLGKYHTKERCLEIIDEIQRKLSVSTTLEFDKGNNIKYRQNNVIYNMPKE